MNYVGDDVLDYYIDFSFNFSIKNLFLLKRSRNGNITKSYLIKWYGYLYYLIDLIHISINKTQLLFVCLCVCLSGLY